MKPTMMLGALAAALALAASPIHAANPAPAGAMAAAPAAPKLHSTMRSLWQGHAETTREYAIAAKKGDAAAEKKATDAVVANAKQIADAVGSFYGADAGKKMLELLAGHWAGVKALADASVKGDTAASSKAMQDLTANADEIGKYLSGANPNLPADAVKGLFVTHAGHHAAFDTAMMKGDSAAEAKTWTAMQAHMNTIADALSDAIAKQFPAKAT